LAVHTIESDNYFENIRTQKNAMFQLLNQRVADSLDFLVGKIYLRNGFPGASTQFTSDIAYKSLLSIIPQTPVYNYSADGGMEQIIANCTT